MSSPQPPVLDGHHSQEDLKGFRGEVLHFLKSPFDVIERISGNDHRKLVEEDFEGVFEHWEDGLLVVNQKTGRIVAVGEFHTLRTTMGDGLKNIVHHPDSLIVPGFVDTHIHYPQTEVVASYGTQLLDWLEKYTFPTEREFNDPAKCELVSKLFFRTLLAHGTTTALVFGTVHKQSMDAFFEVAQRLNLRMIGGKVLMNRNCPDWLRDETVEKGERETRELIAKWHGNGRLAYAVTPRFAPTSTKEQLDSCGRILKDHPTVYMHTHLSENKDEIAWVKDLFNGQGYVKVYDNSHLLGPRSIFAHGIHLSSHEVTKLSVTNSVVAHCPTSNTFLGSGLCDVRGLTTAGIRVGLGTDVGGGTSFSQLTTMFEAYKVGQLRQHSLHPLFLYYMGTLGGAKALSLDEHIGNFQVGKEADFAIFDYHSSELLRRRIEHGRAIRSSKLDRLVDKLFALSVLGEGKAIAATYVMGKLAAGREGTTSHL